MASVPLRAAPWRPSDLSAVSAPPSLFDSLPASDGSIREIVSPPFPDGRRVVIIHDVHRDVEAQSRISRAVRAAAASSDAPLVALEGAEGDFNLSAFAEFPDAVAVHRMADWLLRENRISGGIHPAFTADRRIRFTGIDAARLHQDNIQAYLRSRRDAPRARAAVARARAASDRDVAGLRAGLAALLKARREYSAGTLGLGAYAAFLEERTPSVAPALASFLEASRLESSIDFGRVEGERDALIASIVRQGGPAAAAALLEAGVAYRLGRLRQSNFYAGFADLCRRHGSKLSAFPEFERYVRYVSLADSLKPAAIFDGLRAAEAAAVEALSPDMDERRVVERDERLTLAEKITDFALTRDDWTRYQALGPAEGLFLEPFEDFYRAAEARDRAMAENLLSALEKNSSRAAVVVAGGFHWEGLSRELASRGVTVAGFVPRLTSAGSEPGGAYLSVFAQEKTPLDRLFLGEKLFLAASPVSNGGVAAGAAALATFGTLSGRVSEPAAETWLAGLLRWSRADLERAGERAMRVRDGDGRSLLVQFVDELSFERPILISVDRFIPVRALMITAAGWAFLAVLGQAPIAPVAGLVYAFVTLALILLKSGGPLTMDGAGPGFALVGAAAPAPSMPVLMMMVGGPDESPAASRPVEQWVPGQERVIWISHPEMGEGVFMGIGEDEFGDPEITVRFSRGRFNDDRTFSPAEARAELRSVAAAAAPQPAAKPVKAARAPKSKPVVKKPAREKPAAKKPEKKKPSAAPKPKKSVAPPTPSAPPPAPSGTLVAIDVNSASLDDLVRWVQSLPSFALSTLAQVRAVAQIVVRVRSEAPFANNMDFDRALDAAESAGLDLTLDQAVELAASTGLPDDDEFLDDVWGPASLLFLLLTSAPVFRPLRDRFGRAAVDVARTAGLAWVGIEGVAIYHLVGLAGGNVLLLVAMAFLFAVAHALLASLSVDSRLARGAPATAVIAFSVFIAYAVLLPYLPLPVLVLGHLALDLPVVHAVFRDGAFLAFKPGSMNWSHAMGMLTALSFAWAFVAADAGGGFTMAAMAGIPLIVLREFGFEREITAVDIRHRLIMGGLLPPDASIFPEPYIAFDKGQGDFVLLFLTSEAVTSGAGEVARLKMWLVDNEGSIVLHELLDGGSGPDLDAHVALVAARLGLTIEPTLVIDDRRLISEFPSHPVGKAYLRSVESYDLLDLIRLVPDPDGPWAVISVFNIGTFSVGGALTRLGGVWRSRAGVQSRVDIFAVTREQEPFLWMSLPGEEGDPAIEREVRRAAMAPVYSLMHRESDRSPVFDWITGVAAALKPGQKMRIALTFFHQISDREELDRRLAGLRLRRIPGLKDTYIRLPDLDSAVVSERVGSEDFLVSGAPADLAGVRHVAWALNRLYDAVPKGIRDQVASALIVRDIDVQIRLAGPEEPTAIRLSEDKGRLILTLGAGVVRPDRSIHVEALDDALAELLVAATLEDYAALAEQSRVNENAYTKLLVLKLILNSHQLEEMFHLYENRDVPNALGLDELSPRDRQTAIERASNDLDELLYFRTWVSQRDQYLAVIEDLPAYVPAFAYLAFLAEKSWMESSSGVRAFNHVAAYDVLSELSLASLREAIIAVRGLPDASARPGRTERVFGRGGELRAVVTRLKDPATGMKEYYASWRALISAALNLPPAAVAHEVGRLFDMGLADDPRRDEKLEAVFTEILVRRIGGYATGHLIASFDGAPDLFRVPYVEVFDRHLEPGDDRDRYESMEFRRRRKKSTRDPVFVLIDVHENTVASSNDWVRRFLAWPGVGGSGEIMGPEVGQRLAGKWRRRIDEMSEKIRERHAATVDLMAERARWIVDALVERLENVLLAEGFDVRDVDRVIDALMELRTQFRFFTAFVRGKERYLLGHEAALAVDVAEFLLARELSSDDTDLVAEYVLHEALHRIPGLTHHRIIELTSELLGREPAIRPGLTPLGRALRDFIHSIIPADDERDDEPVELPLAHSFAVVRGDPEDVPALVSVAEKIDVVLAAVPPAIVAEMEAISRQRSLEIAFVVNLSAEQSSISAGGTVVTVGSDLVYGPDFRVEDAGMADLIAGAMVPFLLPDYRELIGQAATNENAYLKYMTLRVLINYRRYLSILYRTSFAGAWVPAVFFEELSDNARVRAIENLTDQLDDIIDDQPRLTQRQILLSLTQDHPKYLLPFAYVRLLLSETTAGEEDVADLFFELRDLDVSQAPSLAGLRHVAKDILGPGLAVVERPTGPLDVSHYRSYDQSAKFSEIYRRLLKPDDQGDYYLAWRDLLMKGFSLSPGAADRLLGDMLSRRLFERPDRMTTMVATVNDLWSRIFGASLIRQMAYLVSGETPRSLVYVQPMADPLEEGGDADERGMRTYEIEMTPTGPLFRLQLRNFEFAEHLLEDWGHQLFPFPEAGKPRFDGPEEASGGMIPAIRRVLEPMFLRWSADPRLGRILYAAAGAPAVEEQGVTTFPLLIAFAAAFFGLDSTSVALVFAVAYAVTSGSFVAIHPRRRDPLIIRGVAAAATFFLLSNYPLTPWLAAVIFAVNAGTHGVVNLIRALNSVDPEVAAGRRLAHAVYRLERGRPAPEWTGREAEVIAALFGDAAFSVDAVADARRGAGAGRFAAAFRAELEILYQDRPEGLEGLTFRALSSALSRPAGEVLRSGAEGRKGRIILADGRSRDVFRLVAESVSPDEAALIVVSGARQRQAALSALAARRAARASVLDLADAFDGSGFDAAVMEQALADGRGGAFRLENFASVEIVAAGGLEVDLASCRDDRLRLADLIVTELVGSALRAVRMTAAERERLMRVAREIASKA